MFDIEAEINNQRTERGSTVSYNYFLWLQNNAIGFDLSEMRSFLTAILTRFARQHIKSFYNVLYLTKSNTIINCFRIKRKALYI